MALGTEVALALLIIGILMVLAEVASPGAFILVPATALIILGGVGLIYPDWLLSPFSPIAAVIIMVPMVFVTIKMYQKLAPPAPPETVVATSLVGQKGVVSVAVEPNNIKGKVRIAHDSWSATSTKPIPVGRMVVVKSSEGVHVTVEEIQDK